MRFASSSSACVSVSVTAKSMPSARSTMFAMRWLRGSAYDRTRARTSTAFPTYSTVPSARWNW